MAYNGLNLMYNYELENLTKLKKKFFLKKYTNKKKID